MYGPRPDLGQGLVYAHARGPRRGAGRDGGGKSAARRAPCTMSRLLGKAVDLGLQTGGVEDLGAGGWIPLRLRSPAVAPLTRPAGKSVQQTVVLGLGADRGAVLRVCDVVSNGVAEQRRM